jgi:hypothetical protein
MVSFNRHKEAEVGRERFQVISVSRGGKNAAAVPGCQIDADRDPQPVTLLLQLAADQPGCLTENDTGPPIKMIGQVIQREETVRESTTCNNEQRHRGLTADPLLIQNDGDGHRPKGKWKKEEGMKEGE